MIPKSQPKRLKPRDMPVMQAKCATCPFNDDGDLEVRESVQRRVLNASQHCHSTGWPNATHLCRGARDFQLLIFYRIGYLPEPTDAAWNEQMQQVFGATH